MKYYKEKIYGDAIFKTDGKMVWEFEFDFDVDTRGWLDRTDDWVIPWKTYFKQECIVLTKAQVFVEML